MSPKTLMILCSMLFPQAALAQANAVNATRLEVTVSGSAKRIPDLAIISAGIETISRDASAAINDNAQKTSNIINGLRSIGISERDISTASVSLRSIDHFQDGQTSQISGYQAYNRITVSFHNLDKISAVLKIFTVQGASQIIGPSMAIDKPNAALNEARLDAINNARDLAEIYAKATKLVVKRLMSITETVDGDFSPRPLMIIGSHETNVDSTSTMLPGEQILKVNLHVVFELQ